MENEKSTNYWRHLLYNCNPEDLDWKDRVTKLTKKEVDEIGTVATNFILNFDFRQLGEALENLGRTFKDVSKKDKELKTDA